MLNRKKEEWDQLTSSEVIQVVLDQYHTELRETLPGIIDLAAALEKSNEDRNDYPFGLASALLRFWTKLENHLNYEEQVVFPSIEQRPEPGDTPLHAMMLEHNEQTEGLYRIRELCRNIALPLDACDGWRKLYLLLAQLEVSLVNHIHLEHSVLFERVLYQRGMQQKR